MRELEFEEDVRIDADALDVEWLQQAALMGKYCRHAASIANLVDITKERLDVIRAQLDKDIRSAPNKYAIEKITEGAIQGAITLQEVYQQVSRDLINARYEFEMAKAAVRAIDQRKDALENLVRLHGQQYFAGPSVPRDLSKEWEDRERGKRVDAKVGAAMKRRKEEK